VALTSLGQNMRKGGIIFLILPKTLKISFLYFEQLIGGAVMGTSRCLCAYGQKVASADTEKSLARLEAVRCMRDTGR
jgi:hypothetical protein